MELKLPFALAIAGLSLLAVAWSDAARAAIPARYYPAHYYLGADLSYVNEMEDCGVKYRDGGKIADPFVVFSSRGANQVRVGLWNDAKWTRYSNLLDVTLSF